MDSGTFLPGLNVPSCRWTRQAGRAGWGSQLCLPLFMLTAAALAGDTVIMQELECSSDNSLASEREWGKLGLVFPRSKCYPTTHGLLVSISLHDVGIISSHRQLVKRASRLLITTCVHCPVWCSHSAAAHCNSLDPAQPDVKLEVLRLAFTARHCFDPESAGVPAPINVVFFAVGPRA